MAKNRVRFTSQISDFKKIVKLRGMEGIQKRIYANQNSNLTCTIYSAWDNDKSKGFMQYTLSIQLTYNSTFIKSRIDVSCSYLKSKKKMLIKGKLNKSYKNKKHFKPIAKYLGIDFIQNKYDVIGDHHIIPSRLWKGMLTNKVTNQKEFVKKFYKYKIGVDVAAKPILDNVKSLAELKKLSRLIKLSKNPNNIDSMLNLLKMNLHAGGNLFSDLLKQAFILNRKIDYTWSKKRIQQVHSDWTAEIHIEAVKHMENKKASFDSAPPLDNQLKVIADTHSMAYEGEEMKHCVFTNYLKAMLNKDAIFLKYDKEDFRGTVMLNLNKDLDGIKISQFYGKRNCKPPKEVRDGLELLIKEGSNPVLSWAKNELFNLPF